MSWGGVGVDSGSVFGKMCGKIEKIVRLEQKRYKGKKTKRQKGKNTKSLKDNKQKKLKAKDKKTKTKWAA